MISLLVGALISLVAAIPATLLLIAAKDGDLRVKLRAWAIGMALRFGLIGAGLWVVFKQTDLARVPAVFGVVIIYFLVLGIELAYAFRSR